MRAGTIFTQLVEFSDGFPDGLITWQLLDAGGFQAASGTMTPVVGSVSAVITVPSASNTIDGNELSSSRELKWSYLVSGLARSGRHRYRLEAFLPLGVSEEGVRRKLGLEPHELPDEAIDLVAAYGSFRNTVGTNPLLLVETLGGYNALVACDAVEALAALALLPTMAIRIASKESSGTSQYQRQKIDWDQLKIALEGMVAAGHLLIVPSYDETVAFGALLIIARPALDPFTG